MLAGAHRAQPDAAICSSCHLLTILPVSVIYFSITGFAQFLNQQLKPCGFTTSPEGRAFLYLTVKLQKRAFMKINFSNEGFRPGPSRKHRFHRSGLFSYGILSFSAL